MNSENLLALIESSRTVWEHLGSGYSESVYRNAVCIELQERKKQYCLEEPVAIVYKGLPVGWGKMDLVLRGDREVCIVEMKVGGAKLETSKQQLHNYWRHYRDSRDGVFVRGVLIYFGANELKIYVYFNLEWTEVNHPSIKIE